MELKGYQLGYIYKVTVLQTGLFIQPLLPESSDAMISNHSYSETK